MHAQRLPDPGVVDDEAEEGKAQSTSSSRSRSGGRVWRGQRLTQQQKWRLLDAEQRQKGGASASASIFRPTTAADAEHDVAPLSPSAERAKYINDHRLYLPDCCEAATLVRQMVSWLEERRRLNALLTQLLISLDDPSLPLPAHLPLPGHCRILRRVHPAFQWGATAAAEKVECADETMMTNTASNGDSDGEDSEGDNATNEADAETSAVLKLLEKRGCALGDVCALRGNMRRAWLAKQEADGIGRALKQTTSYNGNAHATAGNGHGVTDASSYFAAATSSSSNVHLNAAAAAAAADPMSMPEPTDAGGDTSHSIMFQPGECCICSLGLRDGTDLYKMMCCSRLCHLACAHRLTTMLASRERRECCGCHEPMDRDGMDSIIEEHQRQRQRQRFISGENRRRAQLEKELRRLEQEQMLFVVDTNTQTHTHTPQPHSSSSSQQSRSHSHSHLTRSRGKKKSNGVGLDDHDDDDTSESIASSSSARPSRPSPAPDATADRRTRTRSNGDDDSDDESHATESSSTLGHTKQPAALSMKTRSMRHRAKAQRPATHTVTVAAEPEGAWKENDERGHGYGQASHAATVAGLQTQSPALMLSERVMEQRRRFAYLFQRSQCQPAPLAASRPIILPLTLASHSHPSRSLLHLPQHASSTTSTSSSAASAAASLSSSFHPKSAGVSPPTSPTGAPISLNHDKRFQRVEDQSALDEELEELRSAWIRGRTSGDEGAGAGEGEEEEVEKRAEEEKEKLADVMMGMLKCRQQP